MSFSWRVATLLLFSSWAQVAFYFSRLPDPVATHFGTGGEPDGWSSKTSFALTWIGVSLALYLLFFGIARLLAVMPSSMVNIPHRDYWLAPERRQPTVAVLDDWLGGIVAGTAMFLIVLLQLIINANLSGSGLGIGFMWAMVAFLGFTGVWVWRLITQFRLPSESAPNQPA